MTRRRHRKDEVDGLLREALTDDLPRDAEERIRASMRPSWRRAVARVSGEETVGQGRVARTPWAWSPQRTLLATAALLALAVGGVVHLEAGAGPLAESLLAHQTAAHVVSQLRRVSAMSCRLEARDAQDRVVRFVIEWRETGETDVRIEAQEVARHRTLHLPREAASSFVLARRGSPSTGPPPDDPDLGPARALLTPDGVAGLLAGRWEPISVSSETRPDVATFVVSTPGRRGAARVTIDAETDLPLTVEHIRPESGPAVPGRSTWVRARLDWTLTPSAEPPPRLLNGRARSETTSDRFPGS